MRQRLNCKARLSTSDETIVSESNPDHNHEGNNAQYMARKVVGELKKEMGNAGATVSATQGRIMLNQPNSVLMALPPRSQLSRTLRRQRQRLTSALGDGAPLPPIPRDRQFEMPSHFQDLVLFDSGPGENRMIIMGCNELLDALARAEFWFADGTFKVVPTIYFQLYSVHFTFQPGLTPAALYVLLANKTEATYATMMQEIKRLIPLAQPRIILLDFEKAAINAFAASFPNTSVSGCYFHLCQSILRKVNELGMKVAYETDDVLRSFIRCIPALAFVPPGDVADAFDILAEAKPEDEHGHERLDELLSYSELTWIRGRRLRGRGETYAPAVFPIPLWNKHEAGLDGVARTTNVVEGWHYGLQALFQCHHPTMWSFLTGIQQDIQKQKAALLQSATGVQTLPRKRYRQLTERVQRAVANYASTEILTYLRAIAHLSHS